MMTSAGGILLSDAPAPVVHGGHGDLRDRTIFRQKPLPDGNGLQNPLLHLFQTEVIPVQHLPGRVHIQTLLRICTPRQFQTHVQIVPDHRSLRADIGLLCQLVDLLFQMLPGLFL